MDYLNFVVLVVPAAIGLVAALWLGPNRGTLLGGAVMLVAVLILLSFQITMPEPAAGSEASRLGSAFGLMRFEWYRWLPSFLVGAAVGAVLFRLRRPRAA